MFPKWNRSTFNADVGLKWEVCGWSGGVLRLLALLENVNCNNERAKRDLEFHRVARPSQERPSGRQMDLDLALMMHDKARRVK